LIPGGVNAGQSSRAINTSNGGEQSVGSSNNRWKDQKKKKEFTNKAMVNKVHTDATGTSSATILSGVEDGQPGLQGEPHVGSVQAVQAHTREAASQAEGGEACACTVLSTEQPELQEV
jgi:hypothetical protein